MVAVGRRPTSGGPALDATGAGSLGWAAAIAKPAWAVSDGSQENAIGGLPSGSADLSLEHAQLVAKGQDLGPKPGMRTSVNGQGLQEEAGNGVGKGEEHGGQRRRDGVDAGRRRGVGPDELTRNRLTGHVKLAEARWEQEGPRPAASRDCADANREVSAGRPEPLQRRHGPALSL